MQCAVYENPYAVNFYKLDTTTDDIDISGLKNNSVVTLKTTISKQTNYKDLLDTAPNIITSRIIIEPDSSVITVENNKELLSVNHLDKFSEYVLSTLGTSDLVKEELSEVLA